MDEERGCNNRHFRLMKKFDGLIKVLGKIKFYKNMTKITNN